MLHIEDAYCKGCALCVSVCPQQNLARSGQLNSRGYYTAVLLDARACTSCGLCALICPDAAIEVSRDASLTDSDRPASGRDEA
jgi:2-oxoglutarate ferredoxin oxidoreductase subunit delta